MNVVAEGVECRVALREMEEVAAWEVEEEAEEVVAWEAEEEVV